MITLQEIFDNLTHGELSHLSIGGAGTGFIADKDVTKMVSVVNGALTAVHKRFYLRPGKAFIQQQAGVELYYLRSEYALSNSDSLEPIKYIIDSTAKPFEDDLFKIEKISRADGTKCELNDSSVDYPIYISGFDIIEMTPYATPELMQISYRANHPKVTCAVGTKPADIKLHIPRFILDALSLNIAARLYSPLSAGEGQTSASNAFRYQYELECTRLEAKNLDLDEKNEDNRFSNNGWI